MSQKERAEADTIDCDLYRIILRVERKGKGWERALSALRTARHQVRLQMHPKDRENTA